MEMLFIIFVFAACILGFIWTRYSKSASYNQKAHPDLYAKELDLTANYWTFAISGSMDPVLAELDNFINSSKGLYKYYYGAKTSQFTEICYGTKILAIFTSRFAIVQENGKNVFVFRFGEYLTQNGILRNSEPMEYLLGVLKDIFQKVDPNVVITKQKNL
ncbi:MAG: hypothetical protein LBT59_10625 [Clostridiales bacterium]|jgi:hypothetical protein|nr:hypothetical protein [Clostridiales bacterium]